jgi:hypothetical protein
MNRLIKLAVVGALSLGATSAFAALGAPSSNSSDEVLVIENATTHAAYALDLGSSFSLNSMLPTGSLVANASLNTSISAPSGTVLASGTLTSFLASNPASGDLWTLEGGQYNGPGNTPATNSNTKAAGAAKGVFTSANGTTNNSNVTTKILSNLQQFLNGLNGDVTSSTGGLFGLTTASEATCAAGCVTSGAEQRYGFWTNLDWSPLGSTAVQLFGFTGNGNTAAPQSYILGSATLGTDGKLTIMGNQTSVPLPGAVWLFGSGLLGLFGVARRRAAAA